MDDLCHLGWWTIRGETLLSMLQRCHRGEDPETIFTEEIANNPISVDPQELRAWTQPRRLRACVEAWPHCEDGEYNRSCCRFPRVCRCRSYTEENVSKDDLEDA